MVIRERRVPRRCRSVGGGVGGGISGDVVGVHLCQSVHAASGAQAAKARPLRRSAMMSPCVASRPFALCRAVHAALVN